MNVLVCTIWTRPLPLSVLVQSAQKYNIGLTVFQQNKQWVNWSENKIDSFLDDVKAHPATDIVIYIDGDDAVFTRATAVDDIVKALDYYQTDFLVGGEILCWPWPQRYMCRFPSGPKYRFPNAGCWVATYGAVKREFEIMLDKKAHDDHYEEGGHNRQNCDQQFFLEGFAEGRMKVDTECKIVLNLNHNNITDDEILRQAGDSTLPPIIHASGDSKQRVFNFWQSYLSSQSHVTNDLRFSVIIPTPIRPMLGRTLASIAAAGLCHGDEMLVIVDKTNDWGATPRNHGMMIATGDYLLFMDDDDIYVPGAFGIVRAALRARPRCPHLFRLLKHHPHNHVLPFSREVYCGNVSTQMFVVPNDKARLGKWGRRPEGDYDFISSTLSLWPTDSVVWHDDIIAEWRPPLA